MRSDKIIMQRLKGFSNYLIQTLRIAAFLTKEALNIVICFDDVSYKINSKAFSNIQLLIEDGPLLQIQNISNAKLTWEALKDLYSLKGFSSKFFIYKEFFDISLYKYTFIEEYLNKIKELSD